MTGQKDRYTTQEKLWKLDDEQLTTPKHDDMVLEFSIRRLNRKVYKLFRHQILVG